MDETAQPGEPAPTPRATSDVDAIVVGSGFGGAVAAARLAQAGFAVTVLERGRRWRAGEFPRSPNMRDGWLWDVDHGLYDVRWLRTMLALQATGWGGGSLAYANVFARPAADTLDDRWPDALRRDNLDPYYDLAGTMLEVSPVQTDPSTGQLPARTSVLEDLVERLQIRPATIRPNLAVRFGPTQSWAANDHGVPQRGCAFVGECVLGCNRSAKNSLDFNYLAVAEKHGATAVTGAEVRRIEPAESGWAVWSVEGTGDGARWVRRTATRLFLAAGAVATTELLLRSRDVDQTLPNLSPVLGHGFSGNGDYLALSNLRRGDADLTTGPTITTTTVLDVWERSKSVWFQVQDGAIPAAISGVIEQVLPLRRVRAWWGRLRRYDPKRSIAFLSMGHDAGTGRLELDRHQRARLQWLNRWQSRLYRAEDRVGPAVARIVGSRVRPALTWSLLKRPVTVHPLGGVPTGGDRASGVVGEDRRVHGYPGLYVMDGSVIPASTGANPSATILASAERAIEGIIRDMTGDRTWRAPEWERVRPVSVPEDDAYRWMAERRRDTAGDGVVLDEGMRERGLDDAQRGGLQVRLEIPSLDVFRADPDHRLSVAGTITVADIPGTHRGGGELRMFPRHADYVMRYDLTFTDSHGRDWTGVGIKSQPGRGPAARYRSLTRVDLTLSSEQDPRSVISTKLILRPRNLMKNGRTVRGTGFTFARRVKAVLVFSNFLLKGALGPRRTRSTPDR